MSNNNTILTEVSGSTATIWLNKPDKQNAFDIEMISGFLKSMQYLNSLSGLRIIIIRGKGKSFSTGADLKWMQQATVLTDDENLNECEALARCFYEVFTSTKITFCLIQGSSIGGANGFVAAADIAYAEKSTVFGFSEVRAGLIPATIAPYVSLKTGKSKVKEHMLTGRRFNAEEAEKIGLINKVIPDGESDYFSSKVIDELLMGAPAVQKKIKAQFSELIDIELIKTTSALIASTRIAPEAKEGINAFFEKRNPSWYHDQTL